MITNSKLLCAFVSFEITNDTLYNMQQVPYH